MTNDKQLSPAAQAVRDAAFSAYWSAEQEAPNDERMIAAAALRAAANQVVPPDPCGYDCCITQCERIRADLLAIADELEGKK